MIYNSNLKIVLLIIVFRNVQKPSDVKGKLLKPLSLANLKSTR